MSQSISPPPFKHPAFRGRIGVSRCDITPPVGIYARSWGAATHDVAESIHRPLTLSAMAISSSERSSPLILICADMSFWKSHDFQSSLQSRILEGLLLDPENLIFSLSHSHAAPSLMDPDSSIPGGEVLKKWLYSLAEKAIQTAREAIENSFEAVLDWQTGRCNLATVRDLPDPAPDRDRYLCGYAPDAVADDTLMVGRVTDLNGTPRATLVNYACHPTTLAWENKAISPDYIGAMRETIENVTQAPVFFLLGACGELAPRYQYTADTNVADGHGRQLGYAVLSTLSGMEPPEMALVFQGVMESGAPLAVWKREPCSSSRKLDALCTEVELPLKDWPTAEELEQQSLASSDRYQMERLKRKQAIRLVLGDGATFRLPVYTWRIGDAVLVGSRCEAYSIFQLELRRRFPDAAVVCVNLINGSLGYLPPAELYSKDIYPVWQTPFASGCLELTLEKANENLHAVLAR